MQVPRPGRKKLVISAATGGQWVGRMAPEEKIHRYNVHTHTHNVLCSTVITVMIMKIIKVKSVISESFVI